MLHLHEHMKRDDGNSTLAPNLVTLRVEHVSRVTEATSYEIWKYDQYTSKARAKGTIEYHSTTGSPSSGLRIGAASAAEHPKPSRRSCIRLEARQLQDTCDMPTQLQSTKQKAHVLHLCLAVDKHMLHCLSCVSNRLY